MNITNEDLQMIDKLNDIMQRGYYADGKQVTDLYNKVIQPATPLASTNCSACVRRRISDLVEWKRKFERKLELEKKEDLAVTKEEENKAVKSKKKK